MRMVGIKDCGFLSVEQYLWVVLYNSDNSFVGAFRYFARYERSGTSLGDDRMYVCFSDRNVLSLRDSFLTDTSLLTLVEESNPRDRKLWRSIGITDDNFNRI